VQGPNARDKVHGLLPADVAGSIASMRSFSALSIDCYFIARTGYTGEDGYEILLPGEDAGALWDRLQDAGVRPCGLAARDTLRLEAGMHLYGQDMDEDVTPLESALGWTVAMQDERRFVGRKALEQQREAGLARKLTGIVLDGRGVLRPGYRVETAAGAGVTTSGTFSPTLQKAIALARVPFDAAGDCAVDIRGKPFPARIVRPPFVRHGQVCDGILAG
jgi:aminomethyltransferase